MWPLIRSRRNVILQDLSCWCWENFAVDGWAGIPANGGCVVHTWRRYTCIAEGKEAKIQFSSVAQSCPTLCDPMNCSTPGLPVHHQLTCIESVMPTNHLILYRPVLLPSIFPSIRVFSNESLLCMKWPKYWSFSFSISASNEYSGLICFRTDWLDLLAVQGTLKCLLQHHSSKASILWPKGRREFLFKFFLSCLENRNFVSHHETSLLLNGPRAKYRVRLKAAFQFSLLVYKWRSRTQRIFFWLGILKAKCCLKSIICFEEPLCSDFICNWILLVTDHCDRFYPEAWHRKSFSGGSVSKNPPATQGTQARSPAQEDLLEKDMATHSSVLVLEIPWTEEPGGLQSMGSQRIGQLSNWHFHSLSLCRK